MKQLSLKKTTGIALITLFSLMASANDNQSRPVPTPETDAIDICDLCGPSLTYNEAASPSGKAENQNTIRLPNGNAISFKGLVDHNGEEITEDYIKQNLQGKKLAIYFGFPDCEWFCPPSTEAIMNVVNSKTTKPFTPIFITSHLDPETGQTYAPERIKEWLDSFGGDQAGAIALTGHYSNLAVILHQMNVLDERGNHVPYVALIDEEGNFTGSATPISLRKRANGKPYLTPEPEQLTREIGSKFGFNNAKSAKRLNFD